MRRSVASVPSPTSEVQVTEPAAKQNLLDLDRKGLEDFFADTLGEKRFRAHQVMKWVHHRHVTDFEEMTDLGKALRAKLQEHAEVRVPQVQFDKPSADGTHKWLLGMDGNNAIETVYIPDKGRGTLCVSSQVGCGLNCTFCSTATQGFNRNLSTAEIIGQVWVASKHLGNKTHLNRKLTNVVMMGMGEPLLNFDNVVRAMSLMRDDLGFGLANKRVTLSTSGLVPMIQRAARMTSAVVTTHPATAPSASPSATNAAANRTGSPARSRAWMASCTRSGRRRRSRSATAGSRASAVGSSPGPPNSRGRAMPSRSRMAAAAWTRGSAPSARTIRAWTRAARARSASRKLTG